MDQPTPAARPLLKVDLNPDKSVYTNWTFSSYIVAGDFIYCNFQGADPKGDITTQTEQCFRGLAATLAHAGATLNDVVRVTVLIAHREDFQAMDDVYKRQFTDGYPVRITTIVAGFLDEGARIQIDAIAYKPQA